MRGIACFCAVVGAAGFAPALSAQPSEPSTSPFDGGDGDTIRPKTATLFGGSEQVARDMLVAMRLERKQRDLCDEQGCVVIVNETQQYEVTGFFVDSSVKTGKAGWGNNQFRTPLLAKKATYRVKLDEKGVCELPVMFVLRHEKTGEEMNVEGLSNMCRTPRSASMIRLKVVTPTVIVGEERARN